MMHLNEKELYKIMFIILYNIRESEFKFMGISDLLSNMQIVPADGTVVDLAIWDDFILIFHKETKGELANINESIKIIKNFLTLYKSEFAYNLDSAINWFSKISDNVESFNKYVKDILNDSSNDDKMMLKFID